MKALQRILSQHSVGSVIISGVLYGKFEAFLCAFGTCFYFFEYTEVTRFNIYDLLGY
jgi:hypothetical protein